MISKSVSRQHTIVTRLEVVVDANTPVVVGGGCGCGVSGGVCVKRRLEGRGAVAYRDTGGDGDDVAALVQEPAAVSVL